MKWWFRNGSKMRISKHCCENLAQTWLASTLVTQTLQKHKAVEIQNPISTKPPLRKARIQRYAIETKRAGLRTNSEPRAKNTTKRRNKSQKSNLTWRAPPTGIAAVWPSAQG